MNVVIQYIAFIYFLLFLGQKVVRKNKLILWELFFNQSFKDYEGNKQEEQLDLIKNFLQGKKSPIFPFLVTSIPMIGAYLIAAKYAAFGPFWFVLGILYTFMVTVTLVCFLLVGKFTAGVDAKEIDRSAQESKLEPRQKLSYRIRWMVWEPSKLILWIIAFRHLYVF